MSVIYPLSIVFLCLSVNACNARSFRVVHVEYRSSEIKLSDQVENGLKKVEIMKLGLQERRKRLIDGKSRILSSSLNVVSNKRFDSVSMAAPPKTRSFDHPIFHSDYDRPKPKAPCHN